MRVQRCSLLLVFLCFAAAAAQQSPVSPEDPVAVFLDESGVESRFVNPVRPISVDGQPLQFINNTGNRTFVVTIPFVYSSVELASAYATADGVRGEQTVSEIACNALEWNKGEPCSPSEREEIDTLEGLRVLLEAVMAAKPTILSSCDPLLKTSDCVVESLFWTATCRMGQEINAKHKRPLNDPSGEEARDAALLRYALGGEPGEDLENSIELEAPIVLDRLLSPDAKPGACDLATASGHQTRILGKLTVTAASAPLIEPIAAEAKVSGLKARFGAARVELAKKELVENIRVRMGFAAHPNGPMLDEYDTPKKPFHPDVQNVLRKLENLRSFLAKKERDTGDNKKAFLNCQLREVEAAGKLLASYSPDASVPYSGVPPSLVEDQQKHCINMAQDSGTLLKFLAERNNEQGIEITSCSGTTCSATATIPPYQRATFSPSVLAHHPTPRIAFNVSFFGDPESPANPVGYVTRSDAQANDEKPKSTFNLQLGGSSTLAMEPNLKLEEEEEVVSGQLRHLGGSGSLSFQYSGPVEASATIQFKKGDFQDDSSKQLEASQYQAKVYGPRRIVFQYGRIPFAAPSAGIAINVTGEGVQLLKDRISVAYVVRRESATGEPDKLDKDSDLWLAQLKSHPFWKGSDFLRTFDLIAVYGQDRNDKAPKPAEGSMDPPPVDPLPYWYYGGGTEVRWGIKNFEGLSGSLALYRSIRHVSGISTESDLLRRDAAGTVGLARVGWTHLAVPRLDEPQVQARKSFGFSAFYGFGTGDKPTTATIDEGYLGENASYSNDVIFLSSIAMSEEFPDIGKGLSNKRYAGLQYTDGRWSPLAFVTKALNAEKEIASLSTVIALHAYEFDEAVHGRHWAGAEANVTFNIEVPKNVQWVLGGAYFKPSTALERMKLDEHVWSATAKLSIKLNSI